MPSNHKAKYYRQPTSVESTGLASELRRKSESIGMRAASIVAFVLPPKQKYQSTDALDQIHWHDRSTCPDKITLTQAARDGLVDVVELLISSGNVHLEEVDEDGFTATHHAARYNRVQVLQSLFCEGADMQCRGGPEEVTPLHLASRYNSIDTVQYLLSIGAEVNAVDVKGKTPLHYATRRGNDTVTKMLLSVTSCNVDAPDHDHTTPLHMAAVQGNPAICELLISRRAEVTARDINDMTPLMWAATEGHNECIKLLIKAAGKHSTDDSNRMYVKAGDNEGNTALHLAVQNGKLETCQILLEQFADVNGQKNNLATPLHIAATHGFCPISELLISYGADVNRSDFEHITPIHKAALYNRVEMLQLLMKHGADLNAKDKKNKSPLHCACWKGQTETVHFLLEHGAKVAEVDSELKTALHWAVEYGHYNAMMELLKHNGEMLLNHRDKADQTVLHYAACSGNVLILKTLLDHGAKTSSKDQEERTPLHIAAEYDNVQSVEVLIERSKHETNDDDVDGRTPLLLSSMQGHHLVVQVLLSLGADISNRDDEHRTALMLAAAHGHTMTMKILLDNHAQYNDVDKLKNTALHYACASGYVDAIQMLLEKNADVTLKNTRDQSALDLAVDYMHSDAALIMLKHRSWKSSMNVRDKNGFSPMDRLIARLPEAAQVVLDHCVEKNSRDDEDENLTIVFDYFYLDPGPNDKASVNKRYFALNTMVLHGRDTLLSHPLCQNILSQKWASIGRKIFYINLLLYLSYMCSLSVYTYVVGAKFVSGRFAKDDNLCPILPNVTSPNSSLSANQVRDHARTIVTVLHDETISINDPVISAVAGLLLLSLLLFTLREILKIIRAGPKYLLSPANWMACLLVACTFGFIAPLGKFPCMWQWRFGWIAHFLAWINFIMYLRTVDVLGIYVIMFVAVLVSLLKAITIYFFFCWAFTGSFFILMNQKHAAFKTLGTSIMNIFVMTLGEIEFIDNYVTNADDLAPFTTDIYILLVIFSFLMPIVLMNLMIGISVGDIEKIQRNAYLKRIALQVELLYKSQTSMPKYLQERMYIRRAVIKPNIGLSTKWGRMVQRIFGSHQSIQYIATETRDKVYDTIDTLDKELRTQSQRIKTLQLAVQSQTSLLQQIAAKLNIEDVDGGIPMETASITQNQDVTSIYDNNVGGIAATGVGQPFQGRRGKSGRNRKSMKANVLDDFELRRNDKDEFLPT